MGIVTALAIAIHNSRRHCHLHLGPGIPTNRYCRSPGRSYPQHSRRRGRFGPHLLLYRQSQKAFWYSFASGLAEPLGALLAYLLLTPFLTPMLMDSRALRVAGIMIYISLDELLPVAHQYGHNHLGIYGLIAGMAIMAFSLILLA